MTHILMSTVCLCVWKCLKFYTSLFAPEGVPYTMLEYRTNCRCTIAATMLFSVVQLFEKKNLDEVIVAKFILTIQMRWKGNTFFNEVFKWLILLLIYGCIIYVMHSRKSWIHINNRFELFSRAACFVHLNCFISVVN